MTELWIPVVTDVMFEWYTSDYAVSIELLQGCSSSSQASGSLIVGDLRSIKDATVQKYIYHTSRQRLL